MSNVLSEQEKQQVITLGRLGWSLRGARVYESFVVELKRRKGVAELDVLLAARLAQDAEQNYPISRWQQIFRLISYRVLLPAILKLLKH